MATLARMHNSRCVNIRDVPLRQPDDTTADAILTISGSINFYPLYAGNNLGNYSMHLIVGTGLTGTFSVQASLVPDPELTTDADWVPITPVVSGAALAYAGTAGTTLVTGSSVLCEWMRLKYTHTSGSATFRGFARFDQNR